MPVVTPPLHRLCLLLVGIVGLINCGSPCKPVAHRSLAVACTTEEQFEAIHLDSTAMFETFLVEQCQSQSENTVSMLEDVDFSKEIVFCISGALNDSDQGCLRSRTVKSAEACYDGIQILFDDVYQPPETNFCSNQLWVICEAFKRNDVRASLESQSLAETIVF